MIKDIGSQIFGWNNLGNKPNGSKRYIKASEDIMAIEKKLAQGMSVDDLSEEEYMKLNAHEKAESAAFFSEITEAMSRAERIAMKIAKGEKLTPEEERLISEEYPDLKLKAEQARRDGEELKKRIQSAKTQEEKQQIAATAVQSIASEVSKGVLVPIHGMIKMVAVQKAIEEAEKEDDENKGLKENMFSNIKLEPGSFLNVKA